MFLPETLTQFGSISKSLSQSPSQPTVLSVEVNRYVFSQGWGKLIYLRHCLAKELFRRSLYPNSSSTCPCLGKTLSQSDYFSLGSQNSCTIVASPKAGVKNDLSKQPYHSVVSPKPTGDALYTPLGITGLGAVSGFSGQNPLGLQHICI